MATSVRAMAAILALVGLAHGCFSAFLQVVLPPTREPVVDEGVGADPPLGGHLLLVVFDGLRHDIATDPGIMPEFSRRMRGGTSGELWAGRFSVTSAAVLAFGTGQRGHLEQVLTNLSSRPPPFNSWLENAERAGRKLVLVGDGTWAEMYGRWFAERHLNPKGVAMDVDFSADTLSGLSGALRRRPDVVVAHFTTPDFQMHVHGVRSAAYRQHMSKLDREVFQVIETLDESWTVVVASDHGAGDSGTHGLDTPEQRRGPIWLSGRGILPRVKLGRPIDQVELGATLAVLLGVAGPDHGVGHPIVEFLALDDAGTAEIACREGRRAVGLARGLPGEVRARTREGADLSCAVEATADARVAGARSALRAVDAELESARGLNTSLGFGVLAAALVVLLGAMLCVLGWRAVRWVPAGAALLALSVLLVREVERLSGAWPTVIRLAVFVACLAPVAMLLVAPRLARQRFEQLPRGAALLLPGALVLSYTSNTQPLAYVTVGVASALFVSTGWLEPRGRWLWTGDLRLSRTHALVVLACYVLLYRIGTERGWVYPEWLRQNALLSGAAGTAALCAWALGEWQRDQRARGHVLSATALGSVSLGVVPWVSPGVGRTLLVATGIAALFALGTGRRALPLALGFAAYAWVARPFELPALVALIVIAQASGRALAHSGTRNHTALLVLAAFIFSELFLSRVALGGSLDFGNMHFAVAGFRDRDVPLWVVTAALAWKYVLVGLMLSWAVLGELDRQARASVAQALVALELCRSAAVLSMLVVCSESFWTTMRTLVDFPFSLLYALLATCVWWFAERDARRASATSPLIL